MNGSRPLTALTPRPTARSGWAEGIGHGRKGRPRSAAAHARRVRRAGHAWGCHSLLTQPGYTDGVTTGTRPRRPAGPGAHGAPATPRPPGEIAAAHLPTSERVWWGAQHGRAVTNAVGQPATVAAMSSTRRPPARMTLATAPR